MRVVVEPRKGLVVARETGRREATGDILVYLDADCRAPLIWLARVKEYISADQDADAILREIRRQAAVRLLTCDARVIAP